MHNWYAIESEAEFRRLEWERAVAADARADLARVERVMPRWLRRPRISFAGFTRWSAPGLSLAGPSSARSSTADCAC